ncbi:uncharacterized protein [Ptychodera flava]|uniref:uncharacterized protein isoform X2 n=1 Tax=Ptychodera flava TaxID=63121 RepID=UPI003969C595
MMKKMHLPQRTALMLFQKKPMDVLYKFSMKGRLWMHTHLNQSVKPYRYYRVRTGNSSNLKPISLELCKSNKQTTTDSKLQTSRPHGPEELSPTQCKQSKTRDTWLCNSKQDIMPKDSEFTKFKSSNSNSCSRFGPSFSKSITSPNSSPSTTVTKPTISTLSQPTTKHGTGGDDNEQSVQGKGGENHLLNIEKMQMSPDGNVKEHDDICSVPKEQEKEEEKLKVEHKQDTLSHLQTKDEQSVLIHSSINVSRDPRLRKRQSGKTPQVTKDAHSSSKDISEMLEITEILKSSQKFEAEAKRSRIFLTKSSSDIIQSIRQKTKGDSEGQTVSKVESSNVKDAYMSLTKLCSRLTEEHGTAVQNMPSLNEGQESSDIALQQFTDDATDERIRCWLDSIDSNQKEADSQDSTRGEDSAESTNVCGSAAETNQTAPESHLTSAKKKKKISFSQYKEKALKEQPGKEKPTADHSGIRKGVLQPEEQEKAVRRKKVPVSLTIHLRRKNITDEGMKLPGGVTPPSSSDVTHKDISCKKEKPTLKESGTLMIVEDAMAHPEDSCKPKQGDNEFWTTVGMKTAETKGSIHKDKIPFLSVLSPVKSSKSSQEMEENSDVVYLDKDSANLHKSQITCELKMSSSLQSLSNSLEDETSNLAAVTSETDKNKREENYQGHEGGNGHEIGVYESDDKENIEIKNSDTGKEKNTHGNEEESKDELEKETVCGLKDAESISSKENSVVERYSVGTSSYTKTGFDFDSKAESEGYSYDREAQRKEKSAESKRSHRLHQLHAELGTKTDELLQTMFKCFEERYRILLDDFHVNIPAGCDSLSKSSFASANGKHLYPLSKCSLGDGVKISENTAQRFQNCVFQKSKEALQRMEKEFSKIFTPRCTVSEEDSFKRQTTETFCKAFIDLKGEIMQVLKDYGVKLHELTRGSSVDLYGTNKIHFGNLSHLSRCFEKSSSKEALRCIALEEAKQHFEEEVESILNAAVPRRRKYKICDTLQEGDSTPEVGSEGTPTECDFLLQGQHSHFCDNFACGECQKSSGPITSRAASSEPQSKIAISVSSSHNKFEIPKQDTKAIPGTQKSFPIPVHRNHNSPGKPHSHQYAIPVIGNPQRENDAKMSPSKACVSGISSRYLVSFAEQSYSLPAQVHSQHKDSNGPSRLEGRVKQEGMDGQTSCSCQGHESSKGLSLTQTRGLHPPVSPANSLHHPCQQRHCNAGKTIEIAMVQKPDGGDQCHLNKHSCCHLQQNSISGLSRNTAFSAISDPMDFHFTELQSTDTETESLHLEMSETPAIYYGLPPAAVPEDMHRQFHLVQPRGNYEGIQEQHFQAMAHLTPLVQLSNEQRHTESQISDKEDFDNEAYLPDEAELFPASGDVDERAFPYPVKQKFQGESGATPTTDRPQSPLSKAIADFLASEKLKSGMKQSQSKTSGIKSSSAGQPAHSNEQDMDSIDTTCLANTGTAPVHHRTVETKQSSSRHRGVLAERHETAIVPVKDNGHQSAHLPELRLAPLIDPSFQTLSGTMKSKLSNTTNNALKKFAENREELLHKYGLNSEFVAKVTCEQKENMGLQQSRSSSRDRILPLSFKLKKFEMPNNQKVEDVLCTVIGQTSSRLSEILQQSQRESAREHDRHGFSLKTEDKPLPDALTKTISETTETISLELDRLLRNCQTEHVAKKSPLQMDKEARCKANRYAEELRDEAHRELDQEQHFEINPSHCVELKDKIETSDIESSSDYSQTEDDIAKDDSIISNEDSISEHKDSVSEQKQAANNAVDAEKMNDEKESSRAASAENTSIQGNSRSGSKDPDTKAHKTTRCNRSRSKESSEPRQSSPCVLKHYEEEYMKAIRKMHGKMKRSGSSDSCIRTHSNYVSDSGSCMRSYNERDYSSHRSRKRKRHDGQSSKDEYKRVKRYGRTRSVSPYNRENEHHSRDSSRESDNTYHRKRKHHSTRSLSPVYGKSRGRSLESVSKSHRDDGYCSSDDHSAKRQSRRYARGSSAGDNRDIDKSCTAKQSSVKSGSPEYVNSEHTPVNQTTECERKIEYTVTRSESSENPESREKTFNNSRNGTKRSSSPQCQNSRSFSIDKDARLKVSIVNDRITDANTDDSDKIYYSSSASVNFGKVNKQQCEPDCNSRSASPDCKRGKSGSDQEERPSILSDYSRCKSQDSEGQYQSRPIDQDTRTISQDTHESSCASKGQSVTSQRGEEDKRATSPGLESFGSSCHPPITLKDFDEENDQSKQGVNGGYKIDRLSPDQDSRPCEDKDLHTRNCSEDTASSINQGAYLEGTLDSDRSRCSNQESVNSSLYSNWSTADSDLNKTVTSNFENTTLSDLNSTSICSTDVQVARSVSQECKAKGCLDQDPTSCTSIDHDTTRIRSPELTKRDHTDDKENSMRAWTSSDFRPQGTTEHPGVKTPTLESEHEQRSANSSSIKLGVDVYKTHGVVKSENAENLASLPFEKVYCDTSVTVSSKNHGKNSADFESRNGTCEKMSPSYTQTKNGHKETLKTCERSQSESLVITVKQKESVDYPNLEVSAISSQLERDYLSCAEKDTLMLLDSRRGACEGSLPSENEKSLSKISGETIEKGSQKLQLKMEDDFVRKISVIEFDTKYSESEMHQSTNNEYRAGMPKVRVTISNDKNTSLPDVSSGKTCDELSDKWKAIPSIIGPEVASVEAREASKDVLNKFKPVIGRPDTVDVSLPCLKEPIPFATSDGNKDGRRPKTLEDASETQIREASVQHSVKESQSTWKPVVDTFVSPVQHSVKELRLKWKPVETSAAPVQHSVKESQSPWKPVVEISVSPVQQSMKESQPTGKPVVETSVSPVQQSVKESQSPWKPVFETSVPSAQECWKESQSPWKPAAETFATYNPSCVLQMATDGKNVLTTAQRKRRKFSEEKITSQVSAEEQEKKIPERSSTPDTFWKKKIGGKRSAFEDSKDTISDISAANPSRKWEAVNPTSGASSSSVGEKDRINSKGFVKEPFKMKPSFIPMACRIQRAKPVFNKNIDLWSKWRMKPNNNADSGATVKTNDQQTSSSFHSNAEDLNLQKSLPAERDSAHIVPESSQHTACMPGKNTVHRLNTQQVPSLPTQKTTSKWKPIPESTEPSNGSTTLKTSVDSCGARVCQNPNPRTTPGSSKTEEDTQYKFYVFNPRRDLVCERVKGVMRTTYRSEINPLYVNFSDDDLSNLDLVILVRECDVLRIKTIPHIQQLLKRSKVRIMKFTEFQNVMKGDVKDITNIVNMVI